MTSLMLKEARSAGTHVAAQLAHSRDHYAGLGQRLRAAPPAGVVTVARGSSDHAAAYCAYLIMARLGHLVTSLPMSLVTLNKAPLIAHDRLVIAISQSGQSPDVVEPVRYFRDGGATTVALVNDAGSPLAQAAEWPIALHAGPELSVAATKSFIASMVAGALLTGHWQADAAFLQAIDSVPGLLQQAAESDWSRAVETLAPASGIMVVGRGTGFALALEAALKFKETCAIQAEAFSGAEIKHGPMALINEGYPLLMFATRGPAQESMIKLAAEMRERGARVLLAAPEEIAERDLTLPVAATPDLDPILAIQAFYVMAAQLSAARGLNPDKPPHLSKVTRTS